jgi:(p)ppGpp synthase/HD superfamily hydrolase
MSRQDLAMHRFAQTNLQLFNQLSSLGYGAPALRSTRHGYEHAMQLFTGQFRASGKTFLAHLVGTASILASWHAEPDVVIAGLLHAAYLSGDFGTSNMAAKREDLVARVGPIVEAYVYEYTTLESSFGSRQELVRQAAAASSNARRAVLMRLANELEELLDLAPLYIGEFRRRHQLEMSRLCLDIARELGFESIADEYARELAAIEVAPVPERLATDRGRNRSFTVAPSRYARTAGSV